MQHEEKEERGVGVVVTLDHFYKLKTVWTHSPEGPGDEVFIE